MLDDKNLLFLFFWSTCEHRSRNAQVKKRRARKVIYKFCFHGYQTSSYAVLALFCIYANQQKTQHLN